MSALPSLPTGGSGRSADRSRAVLVSDFLHVPASFGELAPALLDDGAPWLRSIERGAGPGGMSRVGEMGEAADHDRIVVATIQVGPGPRISRPSVVVKSGPAREHLGTVIVPLSWVPVHLEALLPRLEADLQLSYLDVDVCRLALEGRYRVPLGQAGWGVDRVALHRVAESSVRRFLHEVEEAVLEAR